jgi:hypothetical protein
MPRSRGLWVIEISGRVRERVGVPEVSQLLDLTPIDFAQCARTTKSRLLTVKDLGVASDGRVVEERAAEVRKL